MLPGLLRLFRNTQFTPNLMSSYDYDVDMEQDGEVDGDVNTFKVPMYEVAGDGDFHTYNVAPDHFHRQEILQRPGVIHITGRLEKVVHGSLTGREYSSLMVFQFLFQPKGGSRVTEATIRLTFRDFQTNAPVKIEKISYDGATHEVMKTTQDETFTRGLELSAGVERVVNLSATGQLEKSVAKTTSDAITLNAVTYMASGGAHNNVAQWTLSENQSQRTGIASLVKVAVIVSMPKQRKFVCDIDLDCKTDTLTAFRQMFKKIPGDDPIIFQPDPNDQGAVPNENVTYRSLAQAADFIKIEEVAQNSDVTYRTLITTGQKVL